MKTNQNLPSSFDQRVSGRSKKMGLSAKPEFCEKLRRFSYEERRLQIEILEEALELYENKQKTKQQTINLYQLLGVNSLQEIKTFLAQRTLPRLDYEIKDLANKVNVYHQTIQSIEQQTQAFQGNMSWLELEARVKNNLNPAYFNRIGLTNTYQTLKEALEEYLKALRMLKQRGIML